MTDWKAWKSQVPQYKNVKIKDRTMLQLEAQ